MRITKPFAEKLGEIYHLAEIYVESQIDLQKVKLQERFIIIASSFITGFLIFSFVGICFLFLSIALAFFIARHVASEALGFLVISLVYGLFALIVYWFRKPLILRPVLLLVIRTLKEDEEEEDEKPAEKEKNRTATH